MDSIPLIGPVAFKDADDGTIIPVQPREHDATVASLPRCSLHTIPMRYYQGVCLGEDGLPGVISMLRGGLTGLPGDVFIASLPKSGTTWLMALAFATMAHGVSPPASPEHALRRLNPHDCVPYVDQLFGLGRGTVLDAMPSPRLMYTHMPLSLLPASITANPGCKIIYICRDQKDRVVSIWHFLKRGLPDLSLSEVFDAVCEGRSLGEPAWDHILGYWRLSNVEPSKVLFLVYERVLQDPATTVRELAQFVGRPFSGAEEESSIVAQIVKLCSLEYLKNLKANKEGTQGGSYFRKGMAGDWVNHMTHEMGERLDAIIQEKLDGSGLSLLAV